jgi:hypothetical protein
LSLALATAILLGAFQAVHVGSADRLLQATVPLDSNHVFADSHHGVGAVGMRQADVTACSEFSVPHATILAKVVKQPGIDKQQLI